MGVVLSDSNNDLLIVFLLIAFLVHNFQQPKEDSFVAL